MMQSLHRQIRGHQVTMTRNNHKEYVIVFASFVNPYDFATSPTRSLYVAWQNLLILSELSYLIFIVLHMGKYCIL